MTPTVQKANSANTMSAWFNLVIGMIIAMLFYKLTGFWGFFIINGVFAFFAFESARQRNIVNLMIEAEIVLGMRKDGYNEIRMEVLKMEEQAEHEPIRLERYRKTQLAKLIRSIMEDVKEEIDSHELKKD